MAEFRLDCWNKINRTNDSESKYIISDDLDLCEGCGQWKHIVVMDRKSYEMEEYRYIPEYLRLHYDILCGIFKLFMLPYHIYKRKKLKDKNNLKRF